MRNYTAANQTASSVGACLECGSLAAAFMVAPRAKAVL